MKLQTKLIATTFLLALAILVTTAHATDTRFSVDEFLEKGDETMVVVSVEGVVGQTFAANNWFNLIDLATFRKCGSITCDQATLPVLWEGEMPQSKSKVVAHGEVTEKSGRLMFEAEKIEPLE